MPLASNISYMWNIGSLLALCLVIQLISGIYMAVIYVPSLDNAINSVEYCMRDIEWGWLVRYAHANGASIIIIAVYIHMARALYYGSYKAPRSVVWYIGLSIYVLMMAIGIMGYVLPYGQMSHWGATVITNMLSSIPIIGNYMVNVIWGNIGVTNETIKRIIVIHIVLSIALIALIVLHLIVLHHHSGNNPLGLSSSPDKIKMYPYIVWKDIVGILAIISVIVITISIIPNIIIESDNYIEANPMVTPLSIVPEWYLLVNYTILRTIPDKLLGVIVMAIGILVIVTLPLLDSSVVRSSSIKPMYKYSIWWIIAIYIVMSYIGVKHIEYPYIQVGRVITILYISYIIIVIPIISKLNNVIVMYRSIV